MIDYKDIPQSVWSQSSLPAVMDKFQTKARSYKLVKNASLKFDTVKAARPAADRFLFAATGEVSVEIIGMPSFDLKFSGTGEYKREERRLYLTGLEILNDATGFANRLIEVTGVSVGRSVHVRDEDDALLLSLFPEPTA